jgi:hypothetical protein
MHGEDNAAIMKFNEHMINKDALMPAYEQGESLVGVFTTLKIELNVMS